MTATERAITVRTILDDLLNIIATVANEVVSRLHTPTPTARVKPEVAKLVAETLAAEAPEEVASA